MRVRSGPFSLCCVLSVAAAAQTGAPPAAPLPSPAAGPAMQSFRSEAMHLSYSYPAGFTDAGAIVGAAFQASVGESPLVGKEAAHCITLPFSAMNTAGGQLQIVLLVRLDAGCLKRNFTAEQLPEVTAGEVQGLSASGAKPSFGEPVRFAVGGHAAQQLKGSFTLPTGDSMRAMVTCVLVKPDIACWQFLGNTDDALKAMSAFPVTLEGAAPAPLAAPTAPAAPAARP